MKYIVKTESGDDTIAGRLVWQTVESAGMLAFKREDEAVIAIFPAGQWSSVHLVIDTPAAQE